MSLRRPVITGTGIISAVGHGTRAVWDSLRAGRGGLGPLTLFSSTRYGRHLVGQVREDIDGLAGEVRGSRSDKLAWLAAKEAIQQATATEGDNQESSFQTGSDSRRFGIPTAIAPERRGVVLGSTVGGMLGTEQYLNRLWREHRHRCGELRFHECASATDLCARWLEARGPCTTVSTACSAGAMAIAMAAQFIAVGEADFILAGGTDSLCRLTLNGFGSLLLLDPEGCRPFDGRRAGISLGEGAGMLVLEAEETAVKRGARILARVQGWGASCDAFHATAPHPEGRGAFAAMQKALARAELTPTAIDFVSAHGTGTPDNDAMEAKALRELFGGRPPPMSSVKRFFGHTLAASGAIKAVVFVQSLLDQHVPASLGFEQTDPALGLEPVRQFQPLPLRHVLSSSFGFGGNNVALVLTAESKRGLGCLRSDSPGAAPAGAGVAGRGDSALGGSEGLGGGSEHRTFAVVGAGVVSSAGSTLGEVFAAFERNPGPPSRLELSPPFPGVHTLAHACGEFGIADSMEPSKRRRLSRFQQMALVAARQSLPEEMLTAVDPDRVCVALGTGLGALNDTTAFCENLVLKEERAPRPLLFTNSVHNAQAAQVALELGLRGLNVTPVQREICFESALCQGVGELSSGEATLALVGAADELSPYLLAVGTRWGWWQDRSAVLQPCAQGTASRLHPLPGEGAALFALTGSNTRLPRLASVSAVRIGRYPALSNPVSSGGVTAGKFPADKGGLNPEAEAEWICETLEQAGESGASVDWLLTGASGWPPLDEAYQEVAQALSRRVGRQIVCGAYKAWCGEYYAASAFGFLTAIGLVRGEISASRCLACVGERSVPVRRPGKVVLYTLSPKGSKGMCCVCT